MKDNRRITVDLGADLSEFERVLFTRSIDNLMEYGILDNVYTGWSSLSPIKRAIDRGEWTFRIPHNELALIADVLFVHSEVEGMAYPHLSNKLLGKVAQIICDTIGVPQHKLVESFV